MGVEKMKASSAMLKFALVIACVCNDCNPIIDANHGVLKTLKSNKLKLLF